MRGHSKGVRKVLGAAAAGAMVLVAAGCGGSDSGSDSGTVTIWTSVDPPILEGLQKGMEPLAKDAGITVKWQRVENINQLIMTKIQANDTPDIAMIPQPGVVADIVDRGAAQPLDDVVDMSALEQSMVSGGIEAGTVDDKFYGLLTSMNVKSLVYYNKPAWEKAGYPIPKTIDELNQLTEQIKADGGTPWCMGIESDTATGWPATDWFEDLIMRYGGADGYNSWVSHETPFDSDLVRQAAAEFETLMFTDGNVLGGREAISSTNFGTAGNPMFDEGGPSCWMYKQGSFITGFFPEDIVKNLEENVGVFGFPPAEAGGENPVLGGGDLAVLLSDSEDAKTAMTLLAKTEVGNEAPGIPASTFLSPHKDFDSSLYPNSLAADAADVAYNASVLLFDGSDQMPGEVGAGSFWREMTAWISGQQDLDTTLTNIDESWPQ